MLKRIHNFLKTLGPRTAASLPLPLEPSFLEPLESREFLSAVPLLDTKLTSTATFTTDSDAVVRVELTGGRGNVRITERLRDGIGNDNGILEDGEQIGDITITGASSDFSLTITDISPARTNYYAPYDIKVGAIVSDKVVDTISLLSENYSYYFAVESFRGPGFSEGGGLIGPSASFIGNAEGKAIAIGALPLHVTIDVDSIYGSVTVDGDVAGRIKAGGADISFKIGKSLTRDGEIVMPASLSNLNISGAVAGNIYAQSVSNFAAGSIASTANVTIEYSNSIHVSGVIAGDLNGYEVSSLTAGSVAPTASVSIQFLYDKAEVAGMLSGSFLVNAYDATLKVGGGLKGASVRTASSLTLTVGRDIDASSFVQSAYLNGRVGGNVAGRIIVDQQGRLDVTGNMTNTSHFRSYIGDLSVGGNLDGFVFTTDDLGLRVRGGIGANANIRSTFLSRYEGIDADGNPVINTDSTLVTGNMAGRMAVEMAFLDVASIFTGDVKATGQVSLGHLEGPYSAGKFGTISFSNRMLGNLRIGYLAADLRFTSDVNTLSVRDFASTSRVLVAGSLKKFTSGRRILERDRNRLLVQGWPGEYGPTTLEVIAIKGIG